MKNEKLIGVLRGALVVVLGILIAILGGVKVVDIYFGVVAAVLGLAYLAMAFYGARKKKEVLVSSLVLGGALVAISVGLFVGYISFGQLVNLLVIAILGAGVGLMLYSFYLLIKKNTTGGLILLIIGLIFVLLPVLFLTVSGFAKFFWVLVGVIVAISGVIMIVDEFRKKKILVIVTSKK